ncbi:MAG: hypothetical protein EHM40_03145 [Chloroflexi bacterium]|nr:MAG: hypothetical protein EHM40_03145 [Chloroflexota bacterium]
MTKSTFGLGTSVRQMLAGMGENNGALVPRGATPEFINGGQTLLDKLESLQSERDKIIDTLKTQRDTARAAIKAKKAAIAVTRAQLKTWKTESAKIVKRTYRNQKEKWVDFGIAVKFAKSKKKSKQ